MIPVHASFGLETKNPHHQLVEYSVEANMDGVKFTEAQLKSPGLLMKAKVDEVSHNYYNIRLFKVHFEYASVHFFSHLNR